jgi:hypothetical protein
MVIFKIILGSYNEILVSTALFKDIYKVVSNPDNYKMLLFKSLTGTDAPNAVTAVSFLSNFLERLYSEIEINIIDNNKF